MGQATNEAPGIEGTTNRMRPEAVHARNLDCPAPNLLQRSIAFESNRAKAAKLPRHPSRSVVGSRRREAGSDPSRANQLRPVFCPSHLRRQAGSSSAEIEDKRG